MGKNNDNAEELGGYLAQLFGEFFSNNAWYEKSYNRNQAEVLVLLEKLTVMQCSGYEDNSFIPQCLLKLDLYKLPEYNPVYKKTIKSIKKNDRYYIFDAKWFFQETLKDLVAWDLDVSAYLIQRLVDVTKSEKTRLNT